MKMLKEVRAAHGMSQDKLGELLGVAQNTISQWEHGARVPDAEALYKIARIFGVSVDYVLGRNTVSRRSWSARLSDAYTRADRRTRKAVCVMLDTDYIDPELERAGIISMPVYEDPAAAGDPLMASSAYESMDFKFDEVPEGADFAVKIRGQSMEPTIKDGQLVWVKRQLSMDDGEIGVFMIGDGAVCKRVRLTPQGRVKLLESDNPAFPSLHGKTLLDIRAVGKVIGVGPEYL